jgi:glutathione synthase/RimK-type ligase-like ATP-grasp enzyme
MKIGIHDSRGFFSDRWIRYCEDKGISYKLVDCYGTDIIKQLDDCDALMWHFNHKGPKESKFAKQLLFALQASGKTVFPDYNTMWHFDDKVAQKYLLEGTQAPMPASHVFYSSREAMVWAKHTTYPKVFKLRNGAGSDNVRLVRNKADAISLINKAFGKGFRQYDAWRNLKERIRKFGTGKTTMRDVLKGVVRLVYTTDYDRVTGREVGYIYFQDFIPGNDSDVRVIIIGDKAFAIKRMVRENDFRASGSGTILYDKGLFDEETIRLSFEVSYKLKAQCMAYDFVYLDGKPMIVEISYGFSMSGYDDCPGYWDKELNWIEGKFNPYGWMIEYLITTIKSSELYRVSSDTINR